MQRADQAERTGDPTGQWDDAGRAERLAEIIDEHGWPTRDLVGTDGATAAWLIAQHADHDVDFQERALELMREAVEAGQASPSDLAYLERSRNRRPIARRSADLALRRAIAVGR